MEILRTCSFPNKAFKSWRDYIRYVQESLVDFVFENGKGPFSIECAQPWMFEWAFQKRERESEHLHSKFLRKWVMISRQKFSADSAQSLSPSLSRLSHWKWILRQFRKPIGRFFLFLLPPPKEDINHRNLAACIYRTRICRWVKNQVQNEWRTSSGSSINYFLPL